MGMGIGHGLHAVRWPKAIKQPIRDQPAPIGFKTLFKQHLLPVFQRECKEVLLAFSRCDIKEMHDGSY